MYEILVDHKIKCIQVFKLVIEDLNNMGSPLGDNMRFVEAIPKEKEEQEKKVMMAGENCHTYLPNSNKAIYI